MEKKLDIKFDPTIPKVLFDNKLTIIFSTYQAGRLMMIGSSDGYNIQQTPITYKKPMGIAVEENRIAIASFDEISFYTSNDHIIDTANLKNFDRMYLYRASYNTNTLDIHDIHFDQSGVWGVNTLFSCLCKFTLQSSFSPRWKPPFITDIVPEDRCHLNGLALENNKPKYVTALSSTDHKDGWREDIMNSGILMDVTTNEILCENLAMPHSPRIINNELYFLESARGKLFKWNSVKKEKELIYNFNRFIRGIKHFKGILFIAFSKIRENSKSFNKVEVKENSKNAGFTIFDLRTKTSFGELLYNTTIDEIYDLNIIEGCHKPGMITKSNKNNKNIIVTPQSVFWKKIKNDNQKD